MSASVDQLTRFLAGTQGREKFCRLIQYFARFYAFYLYRNGAGKEVVQQWTNLKVHTGNARKFFRLLKQFEFAAGTIRSFSIKDGLIRFTSVVKNASMVLYFTSEVIVLANSIGFHKVENAKKIQDQGLKCWAVALAMSLLTSFYKFRLLSSRAAVLSKNRQAISEKSSAEQVEELKAEGKALAVEKRALQKQVIQDLLDMTIPAAGLGWADLDDGIVGLAGMITSWMAIVPLWNKAA